MRANRQDFFFDSSTPRVIPDKIEFVGTKRTGKGLNPNNPQTNPFLEKITSGDELKGGLFFGVVQPCLCSVDLETFWGLKS